MARSRQMEITPDDIPVLPPFDSSPFDLKATLSDGTVEIMKVLARGPAMAMITALSAIQRWPNDKVAKLRSLSL